MPVNFGLSAGQVLLALLESAHQLAGVLTAPLQRALQGGDLSPGAYQFGLGRIALGGDPLPLQPAQASEDGGQQAGPYPDRYQSQ